jgi:predicted TIM-barrel fold metal-dependent hydrolase
MTSPDIPLCAAHDPHPRAPAVPFPALACDCHAHVCGPESRYPYWPERIYTPPDALPVAYRHLLDTLGCERGVLVQPSVYDTDNRAMLDALTDDPKRLRGVAVVPFDVDVAQIERMHVLGVRGVRCNIVDLKTGKGQLPLDALKALGTRVKPFGWHVEFLMHVNEFPDLDRQLAGFPVPVVFGHLGYAPATNGTGDAGVQALMRLMKDGKAWAKMTGPYRLTPAPLPYAAADDFAFALVDAAPGRLVWGSDWPHVMVKSGMPNDGELADLLAHWVPDAATRKRILVDNAAALYGF